MKLHLGRNIYGLGAIAFGLITLFWHQIYSLDNISHPLILVYFTGVIELIGGLAIHWQKTVKFGSLILIAVFLIFSLYWIPQIIAAPLAYTYWGNFFEMFSVVLAGVIVFASSMQNNLERAAKIERAVYRCFGICAISYSLYQLFYLSDTADLVPKWIPFGQMFWAVATTIAFALAAFAIISGRSAFLASRFLTAMLISFCFLVWFPLSFIDPFEISNWARNAETLCVAGSVWVISDLLSQQKINKLKFSFGKLLMSKE